MRAADSEFDRATSLTRGPQAGERTAHLDDQWRIGNGINGGLLMAIGAAALRLTLTPTAPTPTHSPSRRYFLSPSEPGPLSVRTEVLRVGRTHVHGSGHAHPDRRGRYAA
jgi:acyl-coenzyme A thioesterase PaaI-like protein